MENSLSAAEGLGKGKAGTIRGTRSLPPPAPTCTRWTAPPISGGDRVGTSGFTCHLFTGHLPILEAGVLITIRPQHQTRAAPRTLTPTSHQHWEHPGSVQCLPDSYMVPRCQQAEGPGVGCGAVGPLGKEGVTAFSWSCEGGLRVPNRGTLGTGVAIGVASSLVRAEGEAAGSAEVEDGRQVVLTPAGGPGAPEGGLCPGEKAGRPASGSSSSILGGCCRGCRMADGASTAFGKAETEAQGCLEGGDTEGPRLSATITVTECLWASFLHQHNGSNITSSTLKYWGCRHHHTGRWMEK